MISRVFFAAQMADLIKFGVKITAGNSFCGRFGVTRDKDSPEPEWVAYPAVNFDQDLGRGPNLGVPEAQNGPNKRVVPHAIVWATDILWRAAIFHL